jgi:hypothetical protein
MGGGGSTIIWRNWTTSTLNTLYILVKLTNPFRAIGLICLIIITSDLETGVFCCFLPLITRKSHYRAWSETDERKGDILPIPYIHNDGKTAFDINKISCVIYWRSIAFEILGCVHNLNSSINQFTNCCWGFDELRSVGIRTNILTSSNTEKP